MLSVRSALPLDLPLRPSRCLYYYLLSAHMLSLQLIVAIDWEEMGISFLLVALLTRHYYLILRNESSRWFDTLSYRSPTGWQLHQSGTRPVSVTPVSVRWLASRWVLIQLLRQSSAKTPLELVLCPDVLSAEQARQLKQYLILYGRSAKKDKLILAGADRERF